MRSCPFFHSSLSSPLEFQLYRLIDYAECNSEGHYLLYQVICSRLPKEAQFTSGFVCALTFHLLRFDLLFLPPLCFLFLLSLVDVFICNPDNDADDPMVYPKGDGKGKEGVRSYEKKKFPFLSVVSRYRSSLCCFAKQK